MIDIRKYKLLTPSTATLNLDSEITVYFRNDEVETLPANCTDTIDLTEVIGIKSEDFNLIFRNRSKEYIEKAKRSEDFLQSFYYLLDFEIDGSWVSVSQHNELSFLDAVYSDQPEVEQSDIVI